MKRTTNWSERYEERRKADLELAEDVFQEVMSGVPDEIWILIMLPNVEDSKFCCSVLTRISKQLHSVTHQNLKILNLRYLESEVILQYPNLTKLQLNLLTSQPIVLPLTKKLETLVITNNWYSLDLTRITSENSPLLKTLKFEYVPDHLFVEDNLGKQITKLKVFIYHDIYNTNLFPNLVSLTCYKTNEMIPFISKLKYFKVYEFTSATYANLLEFNGIFVFNEIEYQIGDGFILKENGDGSTEKTHPTDPSLPFIKACKIF